MSVFLFFCFCNRVSWTGLVDVFLFWFASNKTVVVYSTIGLLLKMSTEVFCFHEIYVDYVLNLWQTSLRSSLFMFLLENESVCSSWPVLVHRSFPLIRYLSTVDECCNTEVTGWLCATVLPAPETTVLHASLSTRRTWHSEICTLSLHLVFFVLRL